MSDSKESFILDFKDLKIVPDVVHPYSFDTRNKRVPLIVDNGSYQCRVGWACQSKPALVFKNLVAKTRKERGKKDGELQVGNDIINIEAVRFQLKNQFDRNVVTHFEVQEQIFDYAFYHMGIDTDGCVDHPTVVTEAFLNPNYSRQFMSELLFECYGVPSVCYGVDALFSFNSETQLSSGLVVSLGHQTMHIIPILDGQVNAVNARRINIGGFHVTSYLHRLLQLKYPVHLNAITLSRAEELVHDHTFIPIHYCDELKQWADSDYYESNVRRFQLPYAATAISSLSADQQRERRKELAKRLIEINARKRDERLAEDEELLNQLVEVQELKSSGQDKLFLKTIISFDISSEAELVKQIASLRVKIQRTKQKIAAANASEDAVAEETKPKIPKQTALRPRDGEDPTMWLARIKKDRMEIIEKRAARHQKRQDMAKRRTAAAQERMRIISELARKEKRDDNFGMRDEDWDVYKAIRKDGGDSDSEEEQERIVEMEEILRQHDPSFVFSASGISSSADINPANASEAHQLHVGIERIRATEILFQPGMIGIIEAGLTETIEYVLKQYSPQDQSKLVSNIFLTGSCASFPGLLPRLERELREIRPFNSKFKIRLSKDPGLSAWKGAREVVSHSASSTKSVFFTKEDYLEKGGEFFREHRASNAYNPSPASLGQMQTTSNEDIEMELFQDS